MQLDTDAIRSIFWRPVTRGDFFNIEHGPEAGPTGGGGQRYIDIPIGQSLSAHDLGVFLTGVGLDDDQSQWDVIEIDAATVGILTTTSSLTFSPRRGGNRRYRIANQNRQSGNRNRHPAWTRASGFPQAPDDIGSRDDQRIPDIDYLKLIIAKDMVGRFLAAYTNQSTMPLAWPTGIGLERLFLSNAELRQQRTADGVIHLPLNAAMFPHDLISAMGITNISDVLAEMTEGTIIEGSADIPQFNPVMLAGQRERTISSIVRRQGQGAFRRALLDAYGNRCAVSGCDVVEALEAAHIIPYRGIETNTVDNGLLLRADLHTLFDLRVFAIDNVTQKVLTKPSLRSTHYGWLENRNVRFPSPVNLMPSPIALQIHRLEAGL